ncbi:hypothetical protein K456DRAFT_1880400 [Colletotrichum gloeosporioides 23]|nr:hypothetical protein K456DRAFT_1880400 [Colletotrichum gloeosporioides 23]
MIELNPFWTLAGSYLTHMQSQLPEEPATMKSATDAWSQLCETCRSIPVETFTLPRRSVLFDGPGALLDLRSSAAQGCDLCSIFFAALAAQDGFESKFNPGSASQDLDEITLTVDGPFAIIQDRRAAALDSQTIETLARKLQQRLDYSFNVSGQPQENPLRAVHDRIFVPDATQADQAAFRLLDEQLGRNKTMAIRPMTIMCQNEASFNPPKRVLDVTDQDKIILVSTSDFGESPRYAALSHCWGSEKPLQTTKKNLAAHLKGIWVKELPHTFRDAVKVARAVGLVYLWIDSLCIIQQDSNELESEVSRMNDIYSHATVTIAATDAEDCNGGLFGTRALKPVSLFFPRDKLNPSLAVVIRPVASNQSRSLTWKSRANGLLQKRGWAFQERELSPRILHYTMDCILWECRCRVASEFDPNMSAPSSTRFLDVAFKHPFPSGAEHHYGRWRHAVEVYSCRLLRYPSDKLPAFAGVAAEWNRMNPDDRYLAGLWQSNIIIGLGWSPSQLYLPPPPLGQPWPPESLFKGVPSWSWAAYNGAVDTGYLYQQFWTDFPARLESAFVEVNGANPYGAVSFGRSTISSWSVALSLSESHCTDEPGPKTYTVFMESEAKVKVYFDYDTRSLPEINVTLLQLSNGPAVEAVISPAACACGLVLHKRQDPRDPDCYVRLGMFSFWKSTAWIQCREWKTVVLV